MVFAATSLRWLLVFAELRQAPAAVKVFIGVALIGLLLAILSTLSSAKHVKHETAVLVIAAGLYIILLWAVVVARQAWAWWVAVIVHFVGVLRGPVAGLAPYLLTLLAFGLLLTNSVRCYARVHSVRFSRPK